MKVLLIHNFYQSSSPSGEDMVFKNEVELLKKNGVDVVTYERYNDEIKNYGLWDKVVLSCKNVWSKKTYKDIKELVKKEKPDIVHSHNIWYLISPSVYYACKDVGVIAIQTLHNFRLFCANGLLMRNGRICEDCLGKIPWRGAIRGCYRNSVLYSIPITLTETIHRIVRTWKDVIDSYIALTEFTRKKYIQGGIPEKKIFVKPNFLPITLKPSFNHNGYAVFLGRLSIEKGLYTLIKAWKKIKGFTLKVIGDGPLKGDLRKVVLKDGIKNIEFMGRKRHNECLELIKSSSFVIMPSECYESFSMTTIEAFGCGKPVVASNLGAMAELVENGKTGLLFKPGDIEDLTSKINWMIENEKECIQMGKNARVEFEAKYTAEKNYEILMDIYQKVIDKG